MTAGSFAERLLRWARRHGRKDLPWQRDPDAYRVWVSEVMLQQTQVGTVIPYYERFVRRFPDVGALAEADEDEVLHHWSGLGYYSRARHLHAAAKRIVTAHGGRLPATFDDWRALPGVGRSTAGAILALTAGERHPILDGNVKRVLCRYHGIDTWPGETATARTLWALAERHTPAARVDEYTQAIMDLGATVCRRRNPSCDYCPLGADCRARIGDRVERIPAPKPRRARPLRATRFLVLRRRDGAVLLTKRPPAGVWGGLWSFPECAQKEDPADSCRRRFGVRSAKLRYLARRRHGFTHFELDIEPVLLDINGASNAGESSVMDAPPVLWYKGAATERVGIAAPVQTILEEISQSRPATMS